MLISYAATEFGGAVAGWNLADHAEFWATKRGSVGRAHSGSELRIVDEVDGHVLGADEVGLLEVKAGQLGDGSGWMRTTDLARIDADGFLWILGRADQAIIRGGFKVRPDDVRAALEAHPAVRGAAVIGVADARLGAVPVAVVELRDAHAGVTVERTCSTTSASGSRPTRSRRRSSSSTCCRAPTRARSTSVGVRAIFEPTDRRRGKLTDHGPALLRRGRAVPGRGPRLARGRGPRARPAAATGRLAGPPRLRHRVAAQALRRRLRRAGVAGRSRRPRPADHPAARVPRGVRPGRRARTSASTSSA